MFEAIGTIIDTGPTPRARRSDATRTHEPVRRHSRTAGRCEGRFWRPITRQESRKIVLAARRYELATRQPGARSGALGCVALEVLDYLGNRVDFRTGRLEPSIETMMEKLRRSRDAIVRALKALRQHGFIDWLRRYVATGNDFGPQVQQTSNAYRLSLPQRALRLLGALGRPSPLPDDFTHAQQARTAELDAYKNSLAPDELPLFVVDDPELAESLARLGRSMMMKRESAKRTESLSEFITKGN